MNQERTMWRGIRSALNLSGLIGLLLFTACDRPSSPNVTNAEMHNQSEQDKRDAIEKVLSELEQRHNVKRRWMSFVESNALSLQTFTLQYQEALDGLKGQSIIVVGYVRDVRRSGDRYRILCEGWDEISRKDDIHFYALDTPFDVEADAESARYIVEMTKKHQKDTVQVSFAFVIEPTQLRAKYDRDVQAVAEHDKDDGFTSAHVVEGHLYPQFTILGRCREVRHLVDFYPF